MSWVVSAVAGTQMNRQQVIILQPKGSSLGFTVCDGQGPFPQQVRPSVLPFGHQERVVAGDTLRLPWFVSVLIVKADGFSSGCGFRFLIH